MKEYVSVQQPDKQTFQQFLDIIKDEEVSGKCSKCAFVDAAAKEIDRLRKGYNELLIIHEILMCPAECKPITEDDKYTTKLLKGIIQNWHSIQVQLRDIKDSLTDEYYYKGD